MTLNEAKCGTECKIVSIADESSKSQLMRMGISEGSKVVCHEQLPMGPVVVRCKRQEIAIGRKIAAGIVIE